MHAVRLAMLKMAFDGVAIHVRQGAISIAFVVVPVSPVAKSTVSAADAANALSLQVPFLAVLEKVHFSLCRNKQKQNVGVSKHTTANTNKIKSNQIK